MTKKEAPYIYNMYISNNEEILLKVEDCDEFLAGVFENIITSEDYTDEEIHYFFEENHRLLKELQEYNPNDYICLYENAMSGYYMIDNSRIDDILKEMKEKGETLK